MNRDLFSPFQVLSGDVDFLSYGGKWYRIVPGTNALRYQVLELINWHDSCGLDAEGGPEYNLALTEVDLGTVAEDNIRQALDCCGFDPDSVDLPELAIVEALHVYGCSAPLWNEDGNNYRKLVAEAKRQARALDDPEAHEAALDRPVNAIGSTAREYAQGDTWSALRRIRDNPDPTPDQSLVLKLYGNCTHTLGGEPIPDDLRNTEGD